MKKRVRQFESKFSNLHSASIQPVTAHSLPTGRLRASDHKAEGLMKKRVSLVKKILSSLLFIVLTTTGAFGGIILPKGSIVQVYLKKPISTGLNQEGDIVYFVNPVDVFSYEENVFPKNTIFIGKIDFLKMPVLGINGAFKVKITDVILPNGKRSAISASLYYKSSTTIGGELTPPASYNYAVHPVKGWSLMSGVLQYVPSGKHEFGKDTTLTTREPVFILLNEDYVSQ